MEQLLHSVQKCMSIFRNHSDCHVRQEYKSCVTSMTKGFITSHKMLVTELIEVVPVVSFQVCNNLPLTDHIRSSWGESFS